MCKKFIWRRAMGLPTFRHRIWLLPLLFAGLACPALPTRADDSDPAVDAIVQQLTPPERTRSFRTRGYSGITPDEIPTSTVSDANLNGTGLFNLGSAELTEQGRTTLNNYVKA